MANTPDPAPPVAPLSDIERDELKRFLCIVDSEMSAIAHGRPPSVDAELLRISELARHAIPDMVLRLLAQLDAVTRDRDMWKKESEAGDVLDAQNEAAVKRFKELNDKLEIDRDRLRADLAAAQEKLGAPGGEPWAYAVVWPEKFKNTLLWSRENKEYAERTLNDLKRRYPTEPPPRLVALFPPKGEV